MKQAIVMGVITVLFMTILSACGKMTEVKFHLRTQADTPIYQTEYRTCNRHLLLTERNG